MVSERLPNGSRIFDKLRASIGSSIAVGGARTFNAAIKRLQLAALNNVPVSFIKSVNPACCSFTSGVPRGAPVNSFHLVESFSSPPLSVFGPEPLVARLFEIVHRGSDSAALTSLRRFGSGSVT